VKVTNYGTIITELHVPDRNGKLADIVLGFDNLNQYQGSHPYFGATVGRVANRISRGRFSLDGKEYRLAINNGPNALHGGLKGFDKAIWKTTQTGETSLSFRYVSVDGEEGYPGKLEVETRISLTGDADLCIEYLAVTDKPTPLNLTNHTYFNLKGEGDVLNHELQIEADNYTPTDETLIPTGVIASVQGTPLDFTKPAAIGSRFSQLKGDPIDYDHNFVIRSKGKELSTAGRVYEPTSGRMLEVLTTQPGIQLYTANYLDGSLIGKRGIAYRRHEAFCLETQHFPDSVNHPNFPSSILRPGEHYHETTIFRFSTR